MTSTPMDVAHDRVRRGRAAGEHVDQVHAERSFLDPYLARERELRVGINDEHSAAVTRQQHAEVRGGRGLPDAALLVADRDDGHPAASFWLVGNVELLGASAPTARRSGSSANRTSRPTDDAHAASTRPKRLRVHPAVAGGAARTSLRSAVDRDQLDRLEPDVERALPDLGLEQLADPLPVAPILGRREFRGLDGRRRGRLRTMRRLRRPRSVM